MPPWLWAKTGRPPAPSMRYSAEAAAPRHDPKTTPTRSTASGCMVSGTGEPGIGRAIGGAMPIATLARAMSSMFGAARSRIRSLRIEGIVALALVMVAVTHHENCRQQRDRGESAQADAEKRSEERRVGKE